MINLTVNYHRPSSTVDSQTVDGAYLVEDQVVPNGVNGLAKHHVVVFRQRRIKKNKYMAMAAIFLVIILLLVAGLIAGVYHPGFDTESSSSSSSSSSQSNDGGSDPNGSRTPSITPSNQGTTCGTRPGYTTRHKRVIHGRASEKGEWPWQVFILVNGHYVCGGAIVSPQWVFTAAHCVTFFSPVSKKRVISSNIEVVAGSLHRLEYEAGNQVRTAVRHIVHPEYSKEHDLFNYDIMLLKLNESFVINDNVRTICVDSLLNSDLYAPGKRCIVAGWGYTSRREIPTDLGEELSYAEMPLIDTQQCREYASRLGRKLELQITPQRFCAGFEDNMQLQRGVPCKGDSGSPLVCGNPSTGSWHLVGLVSSGAKCGEVSYFTNVTAVSDFWKMIYDESTIPSSEFNCRNGNGSVPREWLCDGEVDCDDLSDEIECECTDRQFRCDNDRCILGIYQCDGFDTCGDGSDEQECSYFNCSDGQQVSSTVVCDGHVDCKANSTDESNDICAYDPLTHFACPEGIRIPRSWQCDGVDDCENGEDERRCNCSAYQFRCDNRCILRDFVCDSIHDCDDKTDELNCSCSSDEFYCHINGLCWENKMREFCSLRKNCIQENLNEGFTCDLLDLCQSVVTLDMCRGLVNGMNNVTNVDIHPSALHSNGSDVGNGG